MNLSRIAQAQEYAHAAHDSINQRRKYTHEPYWVHTDAVAQMVTDVGGDENMIIAAHLHDVLEDVTPKNPYYSADSILNSFGEDVLALVMELTDMYTHEVFPHLNRMARKELERQRLEGLSVRAKTVKLCDLIHNTESICAHDPGFAKTYLQEKFLALPCLIGGHEGLLQKASMQTVIEMSKLGLHIGHIESTVSV